MIRRAGLGALAACFALAALVAGAAPAAAAPTVALTVDSPVDGTKWVGKDTDFHVKGKIDASGASTPNVTHAGVTVKPADKGTHDGVGNAKDWSQESANAHRSFDLTVSAAYNGKYTLTVSAVACEPRFLQSCLEGYDTEVRTVIVAGVPKAPGGVGSSIKDGKASISWDNSVHDPDLLGFQVERADASGNFKCIAMVAVDADAGDDYGFSDELKDLASGEYSWRVRAIRAADSETKLGTCAKPGLQISSLPSSSAKATSDNPTPPTTSTVPSSTSTTKPGGSGGSNSGGNSGGGRRSGASTSTGRPPNLSALGSLGAGNSLAQTPRLPQEGDPGFDELLPFKAGDNPEIGSDQPQDALRSAEETDTGTTTLLFVAAGMLVFVLSMHVLWLKAQVDRAPLEALAPEDLTVA